ncbi:MAG: hypothetical protein RJA52_1462 [Bacteroidota bacterium]
MWLIFIGIIGVAFFADRTSFLTYFLPYSLAFAGFFYTIIQRGKNYQLQNKDIYFAIFLRFILVFSFPNLSDDVYRFIWDGQLIKEGFYPYSFTPKEWILKGGCGLNSFEELYPNLNSKEYYSVYPPILQIFFFIAVLPGFKISGTTLILKAIIFLFESITILWIPKLLKITGIPAGKSLWYLFNPLIIVELTGNIHFEAIAISFFILSVLNFQNRKVLQTSLWLALSAGTKILPIIFMPIFLCKIERTHRFKFIISFLFFLLILLIPIFFGHFFKSFTLYFNRFEFNGFLYLISRELVQHLIGYNPINFLGPSLTIITGAAMILILYKRKEDEKKTSFFFILFYLLGSTTVHPWYLSFFILLSMFTPFIFPLIWSFSIGLSYFQYQNGVYRESLEIIFLEYVIWIFPLLVEIIMFNKTKDHVQN